LYKTFRKKKKKMMKKKLMMNSLMKYCIEMKMNY